MDLLDREVFAVLMALVIVISIIGIAYILRANIYIKYSIKNGKVVFNSIRVNDENPSFLSIGLLNSHCKMGPYDKVFFVGEKLNYCFLIYNGYTDPQLLQIRYKVSESRIPTREQPLNTSTLGKYVIVLNGLDEAIVKPRFILNVSRNYVGSNITLIFELWRYNPGIHEWVYTGEWVHIHVRVAEAP